MKKNKNLKDTHLDDYIKANRRGSREAELENNPGFKSRARVHKNFKKYSRKNSINNFMFEDE